MAEGPAARRAKSREPGARVSPRPEVPRHPDDRRARGRRSRAVRRVDGQRPCLGGRAMLDGRLGSRGVRWAVGELIAVTLLTSHRLPGARRPADGGAPGGNRPPAGPLAKECGLDGVVCSTQTSGESGTRAVRISSTVVPGHPAGGNRRRRSEARPRRRRRRSAAERGLLVIGRPVTAAPDPEAALGSCSRKYNRGRERRGRQPRATGRSRTPPGSWATAARRGGRGRTRSRASTRPRASGSTPSSSTSGRRATAKRSFSTTRTCPRHQRFRSAASPPARSSGSRCRRSSASTGSEARGRLSPLRPRAPVRRRGEGCSRLRPGRDGAARRRARVRVRRHRALPRGLLRRRVPPEDAGSRSRASRRGTFSTTPSPCPRRDA